MFFIKKNKQNVIFFSFGMIFHWVWIKKGGSYDFIQFNI